MQISSCCLWRLIAMPRAGDGQHDRQRYGRINAARGGAGPVAPAGAGHFITSRCLGRISATAAMRDVRITARQALARPGRCRSPRRSTRAVNPAPILDETSRHLDRRDPIDTIGSWGCPVTGVTVADAANAVAWAGHSEGCPSPLRTGSRPARDRGAGCRGPGTSPGCVRPHGRLPRPGPGFLRRVGPHPALARTLAGHGLRTST